jgi:phenylalanyl-tRNA synthetase beta chain
LGPLHPDVADALDLRGALLVVELDLAALDALGRATPKFTPIPKFPASTRDASFVVHDDVPAGEVERAVREAAGELAERVSLLDRFVGGTVPESHASLTFHIVYRAKDRTLTDDDVQKHHDNAVKEVGKRFGATLRA